MLRSAKNLRNVSSFTEKFRDDTLVLTLKAKNLRLTFDRTLNWDALVTPSLDAVLAYSVAYHI